MEFYMLLATDADDVHEARMAARPDHLKRLGSASRRAPSDSRTESPARQSRTRLRQPYHRPIRIA